MTDPDAWWHLRLGEDFWDERSLRDPGWLTPFATADWVPTQWLPEMIASKVEQFFGLPGVAWLFGVTLLAFVAGIYLLSRQRAGELASALAVAVAFLGASGSLTSRPHMITYLFLIITLMAWLRTADDLRPRWWLIPLTWIWAMSHGMWFVGPVTGLAITLGLVLDRRVRGKTLHRLLLVSFFSFISAALTPVGPKLLGAPFAVGEISTHITEWAAPSFRDITPATTAIIIAVVVITKARQSRADWTLIVVLVMAGGWTLLSARTVTLGAILIAPLFAQSVQSWLPRRPSRAPDRAERITLGSAVAVCLLVLALALPRVAAAPGDVPAGLSAAIREIPEGTVVFNQYRLGGWLLWEHRQVVPVIDGLTESYEASYIAGHRNTIGMAPGWQETFASSGADFALLSETSPLSAGLQDQLAWEVVGEDNGYILLRSPD